MELDDWEKLAFSGADGKKKSDFVGGFCGRHVEWMCLQQAASASAPE
jgi:hypothetical protein